MANYEIQVIVTDSATGTEILNTTESHSVADGETKVHEVPVENPNLVAGLRLASGN